MEQFSIRTVTYVIDEEFDLDDVHITLSGEIRGASDEETETGQNDVDKQTIKEARFEPKQETPNRFIMAGYRPAINF